jgi:hypothetical protein
MQYEVNLRLMRGGDRPKARSMATRVADNCSDKMFLSETSHILASPGVVGSNYRVRVSRSRDRVSAFIGLPVSGDWRRRLLKISI